jgi:hypothetical protein
MTDKNANANMPDSCEISPCSTTTREAQMRKKEMPMLWFVFRHLFVAAKKLGMHPSSANRCSHTEKQIYMQPATY